MPDTVTAEKSPLVNTVRPDNMLFLNNRSRIVGKISKLPIAWGDAVLITLADNIDRGVLQYLSQVFQQRFPENAVIFLPKSADLGTINGDELITRIKAAQKAAEKTRKARLKAEKEARKTADSMARI